MECGRPVPGQEPAAAAAAALWRPVTGAPGVWWGASLPPPSASLRTDYGLSTTPPPTPPPLSGHYRRRTRPAAGSRRPQPSESPACQIGSHKVFCCRGRGLTFGKPRSRPEEPAPPGEEMQGLLVCRLSTVGLQEHLVAF